MRGLFTAAVLAAIEADLKKKVVDHFDLIAGTSTGGIIALGLGLGLKPIDLVQFYLRHGPDIFKNRFRFRGMQHWLTRKYPASPLKRALQEVLGDRLFGESTKRLVIPSYNLLDDDVYLFRTPHAERLKRDHKVPAWKVGLATASAPTFFPVCREVDSLRLVDGGLWANNPTMVALVEAVGTLHIPVDHIWVLSIGTYDPVCSRSSVLDWGGKLLWANPAVDLLMRAQSIGVDKHISFFLEKSRYLRVQPKVPEKDVTLDRPQTAGALIGRAAHHSRALIPSIESMFFSHLAAPYPRALKD